MAISIDRAITHLSQLNRNCLRFGGTIRIYDRGRATREPGRYVHQFLCLTRKGLPNGFFQEGFRLLVCGSRNSDPSLICRFHFNDQKILTHGGLDGAGRRDSLSKDTLKNVQVSYNRARKQNLRRIVARKHVVNDPLKQHASSAILDRMRFIDHEEISKKTQGANLILPEVSLALAHRRRAQARLYPCRAVPSPAQRLASDEGT